MKRTPLKRKTPLKPSGALKRTPLKRGTKPLRRSGRMKARSVKRSAGRASLERRRREFRMEMGECALCGTVLPTHQLETHEIVSGGSRGTSEKDRRLWLALGSAFACGCHDFVQGMPMMERKLLECRMKMRTDIEFYDLEHICAAWRGDKARKTAITQDEVDAVNLPYEWRVR